MDKPNKNDEHCQARAINTNFEEIFYHSPIGIFLYDKKGRLTNANDSALNIARIPKLDDVLDTNIFDNPKIASKMEDLHEKGLITFQDSLNLVKIKEQNIYNPIKPEIIEIDWTVSVIDSGYIIQIQDITASKKVLEQLKGNEEKFSKAFYSNSAGMLITTDSKIVEVNDTYAKITGYKRDELLYKTATGLNIFSVDDREDIVRILSEKGIIHDKEFQIRTKTGKKRPVLYNSEFIEFNGKKSIFTIVYDITERIKAEEKTKRILESMAEYYVEFDNEWHYVDINSKMEEEFGLKRDEILGKVIWKLFPQLIGSKQYKEFHKAKKENIPVRFETKSVVTEEWFETNAYPHPEGLSAYFHNITERKKVEEELKESEEKFRILSDFSPVGIVVYRDNLLYINKAGFSILGYTKDELSHMDIDVLIHPDYREIVKNRINELMDGDQEPKSHDVKMMTKTGNERWFEATSKIIQYEGMPALMIIGLDITKRKKTEEALNQSQKLLQDIINGFPSPIFVKDLEGRFLTVNNKLEKLLGVKNEELKGKTDYDIISKELAEYYRANDEKVLEEGKAIPIEEEADLIDGHHTFIANKFPIYDSNGKPYGVGSISTDITERKLLEEQMKKTMNELRRSNLELERFAYVSSHDLQEPLRMVTLYSQLLEKRYKDTLDDDADDFIEYIVENAKRMKYLIDDLLEYSRVTSQAKEFKNIDLEKVLESVLSNLSILIVENNVTVTHEPLPTVFADKNQMLQVFENLITNAIKFRGEEPSKIDISAQKNEKEWIFALKDNGIGINPKHQKQIFEVFKRLHTKEEYPGTGIGLSIVQKIIEIHNGRIWVESELGKGSTFYFTIPIQDNN